MPMMATGAIVPGLYSHIAHSVDKEEGKIPQLFKGAKPKQTGGRGKPKGKPQEQRQNPPKAQEADETYVYVVPPQSWGDRSDTKHSKCLLLGGRRLNQLTLIPKPKGSGGARAATAQVGPANKRNDTKRCLPVEASLRPGEAVPW